MELIYGLEPEELGGEGEVVLADKRAALIAVQAWQAQTWGEFIQAADCLLAELMEDWGEQIQWIYGKVPTPNDSFSLGDYAAIDNFGDIITDPRQAAVDALIASPGLWNAFNQAGFELSTGTPGGGIEVISFRNESLIEPLRLATAVIIEKDQDLLNASLVH